VAGRPQRRTRPAAYGTLAARSMRAAVPCGAGRRPQRPRGAMAEAAIYALAATGMPSGEATMTDRPHLAVERAHLRGERVALLLELGDALLELVARGVDAADCCRGAA